MCCNWNAKIDVSHTPKAHTSQRCIHTWTTLILMFFYPWHGPSHRNSKKTIVLVKKPSTNYRREVAKSNKPLFFQKQSPENFPWFKIWIHEEVTKVIACSNELFSTNPSTDISWKLATMEQKQRWRRQLNELYGCG